MSVQVLIVSVSSRIARPIELVRRHFGDVDHHAKNAVHAGVTFTPLTDSDDECRFRKTIRILGVPLIDDVVLKRQGDGSVLEECVAGPSTGMTLVSRFEAIGSESTATRLTVEMPVPGVKRLAAPLLRRFIRRRLTKALDEDRRDLEGGGYPP